MKERHKIFFLASAASIHTFKWLEIVSLNSSYSVYLITIHDIKFNFNKNIRVIKLPISGPLGYLFNYFHLKKILKLESPYLIHSFYASGYGFMGLICNYKRFLVSVWGSDILLFPQKSFIHKQLINFVFKFSHAICSTSICMINEIKLLGDYSSKIYHIPFGVNTENFAKKRLDNNSNFIVLGTVKSLEYVYGIDIMIIAFAQLIRLTNIPLKLYIYGSGSQEVELKLLIKNLGLEEFIYLKGVINNDDVPKVLNSFDIFFALSRSESFGVSVLEALSCGLPVVCSKAAGFVELITNRENGILVDIDNISDIVEKILELIYSRGLREELGRNGINFVKNNYSHLLFRDNILNFYKKQISN